MIKRITAVLVVAALAVLGLGSPALATSCGGTSVCYYYAGGAVTSATAHGGWTVGADVYKPVVAAADSGTGLPAHSLWEMIVKDPATGNTIEWGWSVSPGQWGDSNPHLFESLFINGTWQGYNSGLGTPAACGLPTPAVKPGDSIAQASYPVTKNFRILRSTTVWPNGAWYLGYDSGTATWSGCILDSWLTSHGVTTNFGSATRFESFGEVASVRSLAAGNAPCSPMGSGVKGSAQAGPPAAARYANSTYDDGTFPALVSFANASDGSNSSIYYNTGVLGSTGRSGYYGGDDTAC